MDAIFSIPKLVKPKNPKYGWYVYYRYNGKKLTNMFGLNGIDDLIEREYRFNVICKELLVKLKGGWDPLIKEVEIKSEEEIQSSSLLLIDGLRFALSKRERYLDPKTYRTYRGTVDFFEAAIADSYLEALNITEFKRTHLMLLLEKTAIKEEWSDKTHNKCLGHLKILLTVLVKWGVIEANFATGIENIKVDKESDFNAPASEPEIERIKKHLIEKDFRFYVFSITVFHTGIRMIELLLIKLSMVNMIKNEIKLPATITKNGKARTVPINKHLKEYLEKMNFSDLPKEYFLFGSFKEPRMGNRGKNQTLPDFIPGPTLSVEIQLLEDG
jgi:integrase